MVQLLRMFYISKIGEYMRSGGAKLIKRLSKAINDNIKTENVPLKHGNLTVSIRELDTFEKQSLKKQGIKIDPKKKMRCLYIEGKISLGGNNHRKEYYVQYINCENGWVDFHAIPEVMGHSAKEFVGENGLDQNRFEEYFRRNVLPLFKES